MRLNRFYALILIAFFTLQAHAQPYYQKGTQLVHATGTLSAESWGNQMTNLSFSATSGSSLFFTPKTALGFEAGYRWAPLTMTVQTTFRAQRLLLGSSTNRHALIGEVHGRLKENNNRTLSGTNFGSKVAGWGAGVQYTYWLSAGAGVYVWPQLTRTNGGPSGLKQWEFILPIGLQWSWQHKL